MAAGYTPDERARLLVALAQRRRAGESLDAICATPGWPSRPTLRKWLRRAPGLAAAVPAIRRPPVRWSRKLANTLCARHIDESLREICRDPAMPDRKSIELWKRRRPWFARALAAARADGGQPRTGRRTTYDEDIADRIYLDLCVLGALTHVCAQPGFPAPRTVRDWTRAHPDFARAIDLAREIHWERTWDALAERQGFSLKLVEAWADAALAAKKARDGGT